MTMTDPTEVFRQEVAELLDSLESTLLDLGQTPDDRNLVDSAFRALHTIKGSGAMFGFDRVAAFTHDFETAFDLVRQGKVPASPELLSVALAAKDHIRALIEDPDSMDPIFSQAILGDLQKLVEMPASPHAAAPAAVAPAPPPAEPVVGWRMEIAFAPDVMRNGTDPLALFGDCASSANAPSRSTPAASPISAASTRNCCSWHGRSR